MAGHVDTSATAAGANRNFTIAFAVMTAPFFIWGFVTALNDILIPHLKSAFDLNFTQVMLVQFCFFAAYFIVSPFAGRLVERVGYRQGIVFGFLTMAAGCGLFYPAAEVERYAIFLAGLFVLASGITVLQVSANPYVSALGPERTGPSRLILAQAINSLGHTLGPVFGASLILATTVVGASASAKAVQAPYLMLAAAMIVCAVVFLFLRLPTIKDVESRPSPEDHDSIFKHRPLLLGALAIFLYVGAEVTIGSFLVNFFTQSEIGGLQEEEAGRMVSYYWGAAMIGRFVGAAATRYVAPYLVLAFNAFVAIALIIVTIATGGNVAMWAILAVGFFNSIMFPTIFALAIRGLGPLTGRGSGLLCQAIAGGAVLPVIQGVVADVSSIQLSFVVPAICYAYIAWYALRGQDESTIAIYRKRSSET